MKKEEFVFLFVMMIIAVCAIVYELLIGGSLSIVLGDTILYFSLTIGFFLSSMGIGAYITKKIKKDEKLLPSFVIIEIILALMGVGAVLLSFYIPAYSSYYTVNPEHVGTLLFSLLNSTIPFQIIIFSFIIAIGICVGMEIPIITRILNKDLQLKKHIAHVLAADYLGSFLGAVFFPLFLLPKFGMIKTAFLMGILNIFAALIMIIKFFKEKRIYLFLSIIIFILLLLGFFYSDKIEQKIDRIYYAYNHPALSISFSEQSPYQKIVLVKGDQSAKDYFVLYLNRYVQFNGRNGSDAYHKALVLPPMEAAKNRKNVLILGSGDGLVAREVLKYDDVKNVTDVDIDKEIIKFSSTQEDMVAFNNGSFLNKKVEIIINDAFQYVKKTDKRYDLIFVDFPEGIDLPLARSYSFQFILDLKRILNQGGIVSFKADLYDSQSYWSVVKTLKEAGLFVLPYRTANEYYGTKNPEGMILAGNSPIDVGKLKENDDPAFDPIKSVLSDAEINDKIKNIEVNTVYKPIYLYYFRKEFYNNHINHYT